MSFWPTRLLTSLLYKSFDHKLTIPLRKHLFYRQVFDALYETHDLSKERGEFQRPKKCGLDIDQLKQILRRVGFLTYGKNKVEFTKDELLTFIHKAKESSSDTKSAPSSILHDLTHAVPLMVKDGNYIRWTHKSIQEYFAAQYICGNTGGKQKEVLLYYLNCDEFSTHINLITLCADIDGTSFKHSIAKTLAEALLSEYDSIYTKVTGIPGDVLEKRKRLVAGRTFFLTCMDLPPNFGLTSRPLLEDYNRYFAPIHATMMHQSEMLGIDTDLGSEIIWAKVGVSEVFNKVSRGAEYLFAGTELPFIDGAFKISSDVEDVLENMGNTLPNPPHVEIINDEAANPLNQAHLFKEITTVIETYAGWRFNPHEARKLLEEIENELKAQEEMMRILSF